jgi:heme-degrading monooxygenase HmoA
VSNIGCIQSDCYSWGGKRYFPKISGSEGTASYQEAGDGTTLFVTLWEFEVKSGSEELFERTYGPDGEWARLFRRDEGYLGTRLLRDVDAAHVYVTMDTWESRAAYTEFREKFATEYEKLDRECEGLTVMEKRLGEYES